MTQASKPSLKTVTLTTAIGSLIEQLLANQQAYELALPPIDRVMGGVRCGDMCIIAARPGMGKSAAALNAAIANAAQHRVCFVTLEMTPEQLAKRALQRYVDYHPDDWSQHHVEVMRAAAPLIGSEGSRIHIAACSRQLSCVLEAMRSCRERFGCELFFVDYLQKIRAPGERYEAISFVSEELKEFALQQKVPLVALAQLSRQVEGRNDGRPRMSDLKESGQIEQDADQIILLWRPAEYDPKADGNHLNIVMPKSRHTETITREVTLHFDRGRQTIYEISKRLDEYTAYRSEFAAYNETEF